MNHVLLTLEIWESYKENTINLLPSIPGWCSREKALTMMDIIKNNNCKNCVEIGVFAGSSFFPIAKTLQYSGAGKAYAIDAWDVDEAVQGLKISDPNYIWWKKLNLKSFSCMFNSLLSKNSLNIFCKTIHRTSENAVTLFEDESIDFIHFDGNHTEDAVIHDTSLYFPKIKDKGWIVLSDPHWFCMRHALIFLLERCDICSPFTGTETFLILQKNNKKVVVVQSLIKN